MKSFIFIFTCLIVISTSANSQYSIEFEFGANLANSSKPPFPIEDPSAIWTTGTGFVGGLSIDYSISNPFSVQTGIRFIQKGTKIDYSGNNNIITHNYIEIPVYARFEIINFGSHLLLTGGPTYSLLTNSYIQTSSSIYGSMSHNTNEQYKPYDISFDAGLELENPISERVSFIVSTKYSFGFIKIDKISSYEESRDLRLTLGLAYLL